MGVIEILTTAFCIVGIHEITRDGMIGEKLGIISRYLFGEFWSKPFTECLTCMASVWGIIAGIILGIEWIEFPVFILALAGILATYGNILYRGE